MNNRRIVVADDELMQIECIEQTLQLNNQNIEVIKILNGQDLIDYFLEIKPNEQKPEMIITDCQMPNKNGLEAILEIRKLKEFTDIPVLFQSGRRPIEIKGMSEYLELNKHNTNFLRKADYSSDELREIVNKYIPEK